MKQKSISAFTLGFLLLSFSSVLLAGSSKEKAMSPEDKEFFLKMDMRLKEDRLKYKPVTNEEFIYELRRPLFGIHPDEIYSNERKCYQPGMIVELQKGKITYAMKDPFLARKVPCPNLPFE